VTFNPNKLDLLPYVLDPSSASPNILQTLANHAGRDAQTAQNEFQFPGAGIVRLVTETNQNVYLVYLEVEGLTETFLNYFKNQISKDRYYGSLLKVLVDPAATNGRIPINSEIVLVGYDDPNIFTTIKLTGFPSLQPEMDPNLSLYVEEPNNSARQFFPQGA